MRRSGAVYRSERESPEGSSRSSASITSFRHSTSSRNGLDLLLHLVGEGDRSETRRPA